MVQIARRFTGAAAQGTSGRDPDQHTKAWFIRHFLYAYAAEQALGVYPDLQDDFMCTPPPSIFMISAVQNSLARGLATEGFVPSDVQDLVQRVPQLADWMWLEEYGDRLVAECVRIQPAALEQWQAHW